MSGSSISSISIKYLFRNVHNTTTAATNNIIAMDSVCKNCSIKTNQYIKYNCPELLRAYKSPHTHPSSQLHNYKYIISTPTLYNIELILNSDILDLIKYQKLQPTFQDSPHMYRPRGSGSPRTLNKITLSVGRNVKYEYLGS